MRRILVVEDKKWWRNTLKKRLEDKGFDVVLAEGYDDGFTKGCRIKDRLHLAIIDLKYKNPDGNEFKGLSLMETLRYEGCLFPCLVISGYSEKKAASYDCGAVNFVEKEKYPGEEFFDVLHKRVRALIAQYTDSTVATVATDEDETVIQRGPIKVDGKLVSVSGDVVGLTQS